MKKVTTLLLLLLLVAVAIAQTPEGFKYQAVLRDASGNVKATTNVTIIVDLLQGTITGTSAYSETHAMQTNSFGLVSLTIGEGSSPVGNFSAIAWANGPYFIKITVDGTEMGTSQLMSVPYAMHAKTVSSVDYTIITNKPTLFDGNYSSLSNLPTLFSGSYSDLTNKPSLFDGSWTSLTDKPTLFDGTWTSLSGKPNFATVATTGSYNSLSDLPTLNIADWNAAYGWGNHASAGYLTSYTEADPIFAASAAAGITSTNLTNWNTAYGWGNHASAGYLTSYTEADPIFAASSASGITATNLTNWNTAYGWGNHASAGYLTSYTEADPIFAASPAMGITSTNLTNWNTAYGWGNHASAGYLTSYTETDPIFAASAAAGITSTNLTNWEAAYSWGNHVGLYRTITWVPSWTDVTGKPTLFSGSYTDLTNKPTLFDGTWTSLSGKPTFATVATSGSYTDLTNKPTITSSQWTTSGTNLKYDGLGAVAIAGQSTAYDNTSFVDYKGLVFQTYNQAGYGSTGNIVSTGANSGNWPSALAFLTRPNGGSAVLERMRIAPDGNIGIGIASPSYKLDVAGDVNVTGNFKVNGTNISNTLGTVTSIGISGGTTGLTASGGPITTSGTLTLGGTLAVANGGTGTTNGSITGTTALTFAAGGTNQNVNITPSGTGYTLLNGNVGIGTTTPSNAKLHIVDVSTTASSSALFITKSGTITGSALGIDVSLSDASANSLAVRGISASTGSANYGVSGVSNAAAINNYGVYGYATTGTATNYGVYGLVSGTAGTIANYGGYFDNTATSGAKYGVVGRATGNSAGVSYGGQFAASGSSTANYGVYGITSGATGTTSRGGVFLNDATTAITKYGSWSEAYGANGTNIGGYFSATGATTNYGLIVENGNVGIGTTAPLTTLQLGQVGSIGQDVNSIYFGTNFSSTGINFLKTGNYASQLHFDGVLNTIVFKSTSSTGTAGSAITWVERMRINANGNVGIGTTTPTYKLDVAGDVNVTGNFKVNGASIVTPRLGTVSSCASNGTAYNLFGGAAVMPSDGDICEIYFAATDAVDAGRSCPRFTLIKSGNSNFSVFIQNTGGQYGVIHKSAACGGFTTSGDVSYGFSASVSAAGVVSVKNVGGIAGVYVVTAIAYK
jgi:hypothetical protein